VIRMWNRKHSCRHERHRICDHWRSKRGQGLGSWQPRESSRWEPSVPVLRLDFFSGSYFIR